MKIRKYLELTNKRRCLTVKSKLTDYSTIGKVITRNMTHWRIADDICQHGEDFVLAHLKFPPNTPIYVYTEQVDQYVSKSVINRGGQENTNVAIIVDYMKRFPNAVFLDIGANVGVFAITIATLGYRVIAFDCQIGNAARICASMKAGGLTDKLTVVHNAVSNVHQKVSLRTGKQNIGMTWLVKSQLGKPTVDTVSLDDLLEIYDFKQAVIKMDIELSEVKALTGAFNFFQQVRVEAILMEFLESPIESKFGEKVLDFMKSHHLTPNDTNKLNEWEFNKWNTHDILFVRQ